MPVRYYGPAGSFRRISAADVLRGDLDPKSVRDHIVVVGITATGLGDTFATPFDRVAPGAEVFATAIGNLVSGQALARTPSTRRIDAAAAVALPVAMIALMAMRRPAVGFAVAGLVFVLWAAGVFLAFVNGYWLSIAAPVASAAPLCIGYAGARYIVERRAAGRIAAERSMLAKFQSPLLLDHILQEPRFLQEPVRQDLAVVFLDLSGFTGTAEALGPEWSRDLLGGMQTLVEREVTFRERDRDQFHGRRRARGVRVAEAAERRRRAGADRRRASSFVGHELARPLAARSEGAPRFSHRRSFRPGRHFAARIAEPSANQRCGRHGQRREPASGSGEAAALPRRRHRGSFPSRERGDALGRGRPRALHAIDRLDFAGERARCRFASEGEPRFRVGTHGPPLAYPRARQKSACSSAASPSSNGPTTSVGRWPAAKTMPHGRSRVGFSSCAPVCSFKAFSVWP